MIRLLAALSAFCLMLGSAGAESVRQFNNVLYKPPAGWTHGYSTGPWIVLIPEDPDTPYCQGCYFYIGTGADGVTDAVSYLATQTHLFVDAQKRDLVTINQAPSAVSAAGRIGAMMATNFDGRLMLTVAVTVGNRIEVFGFEGPSADQAQATATFQVFAEQFEPFVGSLKFISEGAKPLLPEPKPGPLSGLWWGWKPVWVPTMDYQMRMELEHRLLVFWPDGTFYEGTPQSGLGLPDRRSLLAAGDLKFGSYITSGNRIKLVYANGVSATMPLIATTIVDDDRKMNSVEVFPDGTTIDGKLTSNFYAAFNPYAGMSGGATSMSEVLFFPDGRWESSSFAAASGSLTNVLTGEATGTFSSSSGIDSQHGTYIVKDGVVVQSPADGGAPVISFIFTDPDGNILIGDQILEPRE